MEIRGFFSPPYLLTSNPVYTNDRNNISNHDCTWMCIFHLWLTGVWASFYIISYWRLHKARNIGQIWTSGRSLTRKTTFQINSRFVTSISCIKNDTNEAWNTWLYVCARCVIIKPIWFIVTNLWPWVVQAGASSWQQGFTQATAAGHNVHIPLKFELALLCAEESRKLSRAQTHTHTLRVS